MFVALRYVLHPGSKEFSRCTPDNYLTALFSIFRPEHDFLLADASYATLRDGGAPGISPCISQEVVLEFSEYVFANPEHPETHLKDVRRAWPNALKTAGLPYFWLYDLRHTFASRLTEAGVSPIFTAQIIGHSSPSILQTYAKAIDGSKRSAIAKLEAHREKQCAKQENQDQQVIH